jgi:hypothetical protein
LDLLETIHSFVSEIESLLPLRVGIYQHLELQALAKEVLQKVSAIEINFAPFLKRLTPLQSYNRLALSSVLDSAVERLEKIVLSESPLSDLFMPSVR